MSYKAATVKQLRQQCRERKLTGYSRLPKRGLWNLLYPGPIEDVSGSADLKEAEHKAAVEFLEVQKRVAEVVAELALKGYGVDLGAIYIKGSNGGNGSLSPKEIWQGGQIDDQDRGGIPHPEQLEAAMDSMAQAPEGRVIVRRKGNCTIVHRDGIDRVNKQWLEAHGWTFTAVLATKYPEKKRQAVAARPKSNGRVSAPEGQMIYARRGGLTTRVGRTANKAGWEAKGWALHLRAA